MCLSKKMLTVLMFIISFSNIYAQKELLAVDRTEKNDTTPSYGANERNYFHLRSGMGMVLGPAEQGMSIGYGRSLEYFAGFRYKRKLSAVFSIGLEPTYKYSGFNLSQNKGNTFTDTTFWGKGTDTLQKREKLGFHSVGLGAFFRINFDPKRGNYMGYYIDFGTAGDYIFSNEYIAKGEKKDGTLVKTRFTKNPFVSHFQYNYFARIGINWLALTVSYRPSNLFKSEYNFPEPPRFVAGLELNMYGH